MTTKWQKETKKFLIEEASDCHPDKIVCHKDGTMSVKYGYFYRHGNDAGKWATIVLDALGNKAELVDCLDAYASWPKDSYFVAIIKEPGTKIESPFRSLPDRTQALDPDACRKF